MTFLRLLPIFTLLLTLAGPAPAARLVPVVALPPDTLAAAPAQPAGLNYIYLPMMIDGFAPGYKSPFGIVMYTTIGSAAGQAQMQAAAAHWITTDLNWFQVEPNPPVANVHTYSWTTLDDDALNAQLGGNEVYVLINRNPSWASALPSGPVTNTANLVAFAAAAAERYDGDGVSDAPGHPIIRYWSFYAEPDNGAEWAALQGKGYWGHNPNGYAAMLMQVSPAIHAANPQAKVLIGGIAYDSFEPVGPFVQSFLGNTLAALGNAAAINYIDAIAFHFYPINLGTWPSIREKGLEIRSIMNAHGVGQLELIVPEMGYWSAESNGSNQLTQARTLVQMYIKGVSIGISHLDWYAVFDDGGGMEAHGLFSNNNLNQPKLAYTAYKTMANTLYGLNYNRTFSISGGEGYVFRASDGREVMVAWATGASATAHVLGGCWLKTDLLGGAPTAIGDGAGGDADGQINGQVGIALTLNHPVYLEICD